MKSTLHTLMQLQAVDNILQSLEAQKGDLPHQVNKLRTQISDTQARLSATREGLHETKLETIKVEGELEVLKSKSKKYQEQLYAVTTNREYDAITLEIDTIKAQINTTEIQILEQIESEEMLINEEEMLKEEIESLQQGLGAKDAELQKRVAETESKSGEYTRRRVELIKGVRQQFLYQYERIRKGIGGSAVAEVSNYACSGCWATIPPQKVSEIRTMTQFILCESCGRILVYNNGKDQGAKV